MLTLLHTSDWHLGRRLYGKPRYDEFHAFLQWQIRAIVDNRVDVLLIAGDIFDSSSPSNKAQQLYYQFLHAVKNTPCRHVVIVAGNHDSPSFLDAPNLLLKNFDIHVIGCVRENLDDEILVLYDNQDRPECIVCAVPYLRDRDVRMVGYAENLSDKENQLIAGIYAHYQAISEQAFAKKQTLEARFQIPIPIVATGHLFTVGGQTLDGDGVRDLYVGSLGSVTADLFDTRYDYVALGHLHVAQTVGGNAFIRYSGSPIAMGFGEAKQQKQVNLVKFFANNFDPNDPADERNLPLLPLQKNLSSDRIFNHDLFDNDLLDNDLFGFDRADFDKQNNQQNLNKPYSLALINDSKKPIQTLIQSLAIPTFQTLIRIQGDLKYIETTIKTLKKSARTAWLEVVYTGDDWVANLHENMVNLTKDSHLEVLRTKNLQNRQQTLQANHANEALDDLDELAVFERCLSAYDVADSQKDGLRLRYRDILQSLQTE
ncbi:exodeoxyribonuclease I [Moraxella macacae 0408225]|uniref:Nuclease SbcCD subunit D n=1 Tax=Moraxella macacae 0408225 TaxID=1230338 RepID=L2F7N9_9GAMM|nr:exonuclease SbcCD subunit D C-terminal domain-containing protein [Moraxella macacae]ELA08791.1 exodeoxyribonuclease I [Moraxella macacae 0408225]